MDTFPPPPPGSVDLPPPPEPASRSSRARIWIALIVAITALAALVAIVIVAFGGSPTPSGRGVVLFRDDFDDTSEPSRWLRAEDAIGSMGASDGSYKMAVVDGGELQSIAQLDAPESSVRVEVDGTMLSGTGGLSVLCVAEVPGSPDAVTSSGDGGVYYDFYLAFSQDGYALFSSTQTDGPLDARSDDAGVLREGANRIVVRCAGGATGGGATLSLTVNGREVLTYADPEGAETFRAVGFALFSEEGPAEAEFDDVTVSSG
jgi:hypothetical protein